MARRSVILVIALVLAGILITGSVSAQRGAIVRPVTNDILWDRWGVPHIFSANNADAFYAFGWAQMENHADLMLQLYAQARGRGAEFFGEPYLDTDKYVRRMGIPERGKAWAGAQPAEFAPLLTAFVDGANAYAKAYPARISKGATAVLPISNADVLAHIQRVVTFTFVTSQAAMQGQTDRWERASNTWAVAPQRAATGNALLLQNPHLPWSDLFVWMEAGIATPDINAYGAALVGMPWFGIAFNNTLGWSHTVNTMDGADLYELELADGGYKWNGAVKAFDTATETISVKKADGTLRQETLVVKRSIHGPVVSEKPGRAVAVRVAGLDEANIGGQYLDMIRAKSFDEFQNAERMLQMPFFTTMYADKAGHIMHLFGGRTPIRPAGE